MISGDHILNLARLWHNDPHGEPYWRTATGRAYYGAYHLAKAFLHDFLAIAYSENTHQYVYDALDHTGQSDAQHAASLLKTLHLERKGADYRLDKAAHSTAANARHNLLLAEEIKAALRTARGVDATEKSAMEKSVRAWLKWRYGV